MKKTADNFPNLFRIKIEVFFDILLEDGDCIFNYQTRWSPNTEILLQIAEHLK